jgi:2-amino-4-hydroxy-6-hydroxymethyldihydropteridine diphosphokinase
MKAAYLLIGGNLGDRLGFMAAAKEKMKQKGIELSKQSSIYETAAWGITDQPSFLNQVLEIATSLTPEKLLSELLSIEQELGRIRAEKNGARTIDIDILYFESQLIHTPGLSIPHDRIPIRRFVLIPLAELIPDFIDPKTNKSIVEMLNDCPDSLEVAFYNQTEK